MITDAQGVLREWWRQKRMGIVNGQNQSNNPIGGPAVAHGVGPNHGSQQSPAAQQGPSSGAAKERVSNQRYRSFAERFVIERVRNLQTVDDHVLHGLTLQARTAYKMIKETGYTLEPTD